MGIWKIVKSGKIVKWELGNSDIGKDSLNGNWDNSGIGEHI